MACMRTPFTITHDFLIIGDIVIANERYVDLEKFWKIIETIKQDSRLIVT